MKNKKTTPVLAVLTVLVLLMCVPRPAAAQNQQLTTSSGNSPSVTQQAVGSVEAKLAEQQAQIEKLTHLVEVLNQRLNAATNFPGIGVAPESAVGEITSLTPVVPSASAKPAISVVSLPGADPAPFEDKNAQKIDALSKTLDNVSKNLAGFKFSGDLRFRYDGLFRSANNVAGPAQNSRARYRVRLNVNKDVTSQFGFHLQLGTGTANNPASYDTDFTGNNTRGFLWLTEYYGDFHPGKRLNVRAGKMEEVFADNEKFLFDDDVRFNGVQEIVKTRILGKFTLEGRAGQYILTNPNVQILPSTKTCAGSAPPASCVYEAAGYAPGEKVRDSNLFHQGIVLSARNGERWNHAVTTDMQIYRNPNQFLIASSAVSGGPALVNSATGLTLAGGVGQPGNGTTKPNGFTYTASSYHVGRVGYEVGFNGWESSRQNWPVTLDVQVARNFGGSFLNNAEMAQLSIGAVKKARDLRFLYGYQVKEANSMIAQVTDDDIGTGVGVNTRTHYFRLDLGLNKYLQWQNILYIQNEISSSDPARNFFVPSPARGAKTQFRIHSQLAVNF